VATHQSCEILAAAGSPNNHQLKQGRKKLFRHNAVSQNASSPALTQMMQVI
jgi:hypothetical protein